MKAKAFKYAKPIICWALVIIWMGIIFNMSSSTADESSAQSGGLIRNLLSIFGDDISEGIIKGLQGFVRKCAHFAEYFILGALLFVAVGCHTKKRATQLIIALLAGVLYAISDEVHQIFVPGRAGMLVDVLLDSVGVAVGAAAIALLALLARRIKKRKIKSAEDLKIEETKP